MGPDACRRSGGKLDLLWVVEEEHMHLTPPPHPGLPRATLRRGSSVTQSHNTLRLRPVPFSPGNWVVLMSTLVP